MKGHQGNFHLQFFPLFDFNTYYNVLLCSDDDFSQNAFVTFTDSQGADTAVLLSVSKIVFLFDFI